MRKPSLKISLAAAAIAVALTAGSFAVAGTASAAKDPEVAPELSIGQLERVAMTASQSGAVTSLILTVSNHGRPTIWKTEVSKGATKDFYYFDAATGETLRNKTEKVAKSNLVRRVIDAGYTAPNTMPLAALEHIALTAAQGGYVRQATLSLNIAQRTPIWTVVVEQGARDKTVVIDIKSASVTSIR